ncbi:hypothetical protein CDL15_Pgr009709 [Punica granatum]|uniref:BHLH domain-containing protein n=1 Tax=Punica granatum TaxID=22663 RepID=A0A218WT86_PUNGR|nr:hypothetical protein CDL15_Pgr009709 [Punica granatum]
MPMAVPSFAEQTSMLQAEETAAMDVRALHRALEWLRPFVETMGWEYVVVWKLGDDPSRFIEWVGCCCSGFRCGDVKEEKKESCGHLAPLCRDGYCKHLVRSRACEALSQLPSLMPLYSGLHGEVVISDEHRWISPAVSSDSNSSPESGGTLVLIPVAGGIVELFNAKHIAEERKIVEIIKSQCLFFSKQESMMTSLDRLFLENYSKHSAVPICTPSMVHLPQFLAPRIQSSPHNNSIYEGSSSSSNLSSENTPIAYFGCSESRDVQNSLRPQNISGSGIKSNSREAGGRSREGQNGPSKNLLAEQRRRTRLKEKLFALRAIVPKISKMDMAAILIDAMAYIEELKGEMKSLQDELKNMEEEECRLNSRESKIPKLNGENKFSKNSFAAEDDRDYLYLGLPYKKEVQVEVNQVGKGALLVRLLCEKRAGWFSRLMEALCSSGLIILDANVTTLKDRALTVLRLEGQKDIYPKKLKDSLTKIASS